MINVNEMKKRFAGPIIPEPGNQYIETVKILIAPKKWAACYH